MNYFLLNSILLLLPFQLLCMNDQTFEEMLRGFIKFGQDTGLRVEQQTPIIPVPQQPHAPIEQPLAAQRKEITIPAHLINEFFVDRGDINKKKFDVNMDAIKH